MIAKPNESSRYFGNVGMSALAMFVVANEQNSLFVWVVLIACCLIYQMQHTGPIQLRQRFEQIKATLVAPKRHVRYHNEPPSVRASVHVKFDRNHLHVGKISPFDKRL